MSMIGLSGHKPSPAYPTMLAGWFQPDRTSAVLTLPSLGHCRMARPHPRFKDSAPASVSGFGSAATTGSRTDGPCRDSEIDWNYPRHAGRVVEERTEHFEQAATVES